MAAEGGGTAILDRRHDLELIKAQVSGMGGPIGGAGGAECDRAIIRQAPLCLRWKAFGSGLRYFRGWSKPCLTLAVEPHAQGFRLVLPFERDIEIRPIAFRRRSAVLGGAGCRCLAGAGLRQCFVAARCPGLLDLFRDLRRRRIPFARIAIPSKPCSPGFLALLVRRGKINPFGPLCGRRGRRIGSPWASFCRCPGRP